MAGFQSVKSLAQGRADEREVADQPREFGPWLTTRDLMDFIPCPSMRAVYEWLRRKGLTSLRRSNGTIAKADVLRVLNRKRQPRRMAAASLANLRKRA